MNLTIEVHQAADCLPDADTDVLVLAEGDEEMQLGAYVGEESDSRVWIDALGEIPPCVVAWAELPVVPSKQPRALQTITGQSIDLAEPWRVPE